MSPQIAPLVLVLARAAIDAAVLPEALRAADTSLFAVVTAGVFGGRSWKPGDVLVVRPSVRSNGPSVLVSRRPERCMLGRSLDGQLFGDAGEPCAPARWSVAGEVCAVLHAAGAVASACERFGASVRATTLLTALPGGANREGQRPSTAHPAPRAEPDRGQLALFAALAA